MSPVAMLCASLGVAAAARGGSSLVTMQAGPTFLTIDRLTGALLSLRRHDVEFLAPAVLGNYSMAEPLFTLGLTRPANVSDSPPAMAPSSEYTVVNAKPVPHGWQFTFSSPRQAEVPRPAVVSAVFTTSSTGRILCRLSIAPVSGGWAVQSAIFPGLAQRADFAGAGDEVLHPCGEGAVLPGPYSRPEQFGSRHGYWKGLGGTIQRCGTAQVAARVTATAGLVLETHDSGGNPKQWLLDIVPGRRVRLEVQHFWPEVPGSAVTTHYDTTLGTCGAGGWRAAADMYKTWAITQPWAATFLTERQDIPNILLQGAPGVIYSLQNGSGYNAMGLLGPQLEKLPDIMAEYKAKLQVPGVIFVPYGWENRGTWAGINYFPAVPSNVAWTTVNHKLSSAGHASMFLVSGSWWVVKRQETSGGPAFDDSIQLDMPAFKAMLVKESGTPVHVWIDDQYNISIAKQPWRGQSVELCHGHVGAQQTLVTIFNQIRNLGVSIASFDQDISGDQYAPCYDPSHPHPPGFGNYSLQGLLQIISSIQKASRASGRKFGLSAEQTAELAIPGMSTFWSRQFGQIDYPYSNFKGVGLFSYLYHEYVPAMAAAIVQGQGLSGVRPHPLLRTKAMADALVRGISLTPFAHDAPLSPSDAFTIAVTAAFESFGGVASRFPEHLVFGTTLHPARLNCSSLSLYYVGGNSSHHVMHPINVSAVVVGTFRGRSRVAHSETATVATVVANAANTSQLADIELPPGPATKLTVYNGNGTILHTWNTSAAPRSMELDLNPFQVVVLIQDIAESYN